MINGIERFAYVHRNCGCAERRLVLVESRSDFLCDRHEGGGGRVVFGEAVLGGSSGERGDEVGEQETFEDFGGGAEETYGTVRGGEGSGGGDSDL